MKRLILRISIAAAAFAIGITIASVYSRETTHTISPIAMPVAELRLGKDCFPGKSKEIAAIRTPSFFPRGVFAQEEWSDQFKMDWYGKHLRAMNEEPLHFPDSAVRESYRFLWLRSFHHPVAVRIWNTGTEVYISVKEMSGAGGYEPGKVILTEQRKISQGEWDAFMRLLENSCYWDLPTQNPDDAGFDGAQWVLEGVRESRYHIVDRWTPQRGTFHAACVYLLKLSGLKIDTKSEPLY